MLKLPYVKGYILRRVYFALISGLLSAVCGQMFGWAQATLPKIRGNEDGLDLSPSEESLVISGLFYGLISGSFLAGISIDRIGRKGSLCLYLNLMIAAWVLQLVSKSFYALFISRLLAGSFGSLQYLVTSIYTAEMVPPANRGTYFVVYCAFFNIGCLFESVVGPLVSFTNLTIASLLLPVACLFGALLLPESPYFYTLKHDNEKAVKSLEWMNGSHDNDSLQRIQQGVQEQLKNKASYIDIFQQAPTRKAFFACLLLNVIQQTSGVIIILSYSSVILRESFISPSTSIMLMNLSWLITALVGLNFPDAVGRRVAFRVSCVGVFVAMVIIAVYFWLYPSDENSPNTWIIPAALILHGISHNLGIAFVPAAYQAELFSVNMKAKCSSILNILRGFGSSGVVVLYPLLLSSVGLYMNFALSALSAAIGVLYSIFFMIETNNKTLEQIQDELVCKKEKPDKEMNV